MGSKSLHGRLLDLLPEQGWHLPPPSGEPTWLPALPLAASALGRDVGCPFTLVRSDCSADFHLCPATGGPLRAPVL